MMMKTSFALILLLIVSCHSTPINTALYQPAPVPKQPVIHSTLKPPKFSAAHERKIKTLHTTNYPPNHLKSSFKTLPLVRHAIASLSVRPAVPDSKNIPNNDSPEAGHTSAFNVIQPPSNGASPGEAHRHPFHSTEKLSKVDYLSSPLRGTETRDRNALGITQPGESSTVNPTYHHNSALQQHQDYNSPHLHETKEHPNLAENDRIQASTPYSDSPELQHNQTPKLLETPNTAPLQWDSSVSKSKIPDSPRTEGYHLSAKSTNNAAQAPSAMRSSRNVKQKHKDMEKKSKDVAILAKEIIRKTAMYGRAMYEQFKSALKSLTPKRKSPNPSMSDQTMRDGYTEEDVLNLVNDIMREIQMRTDDMRDHAKMLETTDRWDPNDVATRERKAGVKDGRLLYMKTKLLVTPETIVEAVMASTKKMLSSRNQELPRIETSKLMKEVQVRLSEVLMPAK